MKTKCEYSGTLFIISRKYSFDLSKSALTPRYTSEGRLPLCNTSSEAVALPSSRMIRTENFLSQIFFKVFLETTFVHVSWYPVHYQPKIFFGFSKSALTPRYTILDSRLLPCNAISEGRLPLCNTSSKAGALPSDKPLHTNKKVQLQLDFLISPAVAGLFY